MMSNGCKYWQFYRYMLRLELAARTNVESLLSPFCGYSEPEHNGDSYQKSVDFGTVSLNAIPAGVKGVSGAVFWSAFLQRLILNLQQ